jgi:hypothetical protein
VKRDDEEEGDGEGGEDAREEDEEEVGSEGCEGCWLLFTVPDPTLKFVMLTVAWLIVILGGKRGLPGPRLMSLARIAAASAARSRSCFAR